MLAINIQQFEPDAYLYQALKATQQTYNLWEQLNDEDLLPEQGIQLNLNLPPLAQGPLGQYMYNIFFTIQNQANLLFSGALGPTNVMVLPTRGIPGGPLLDVFKEIQANHNNQVQQL
jgi:hypothetical protein